MPKIGVRLPASFDTAGEFLADVQALEAAGADLLLLGDGPLEGSLLLAAMASVTSTSTLALPAGAAGPELETLRLLSRGRLIEDLEGWLEEAFPASKAAWRERLAEHDAKGTPGVILGMGPGLLDLLRNPDLEDDRAQDLQLAQG